MMQPLLILDLFAQHFNVNGDCGNVLCLRRRLEWAGIPVEVREIGADDQWPSSPPDLVHIGGGSVAAQAAALPDLMAHRSQLVDWVDAGVPMLAVAGGFQLAMESVQLTGPEDVPSLGIFSGSSAAVETRISSFAVVTTPLGLIFGYQNLGQSVLLADEQLPFGEVLHGTGNAFSPGTEGAVRQNAIGTNVHGPVLPKNPALADRLIRLALDRRGGPEYLHGESHTKADHYAVMGNETIIDRLELGKILNNR
ncbi:MAG: type 1 glutamine amidotransferase [Microbacteriaceae bacterium]